MTLTAPTTLPIQVQNIPPELQEFDQWAAWRWEKREGKWTKPPISPSTGGYARNNDPNTWGSFEAALWRMRRDRLPGIGFVFHPDDLFAGIDLDDCMDPETGKVEGWARSIIGALDSYAEVSPSGTGVKVFVRGKLPPGRRRRGNVEMYDTGRFFTTTGSRLAGAPSNIRDRQEELAALHRRIFGEPSTCSVGDRRNVGESAAFALSDAELIDRAKRAANGEKFARLWAGDTSDYANGGNEGRSEADLALCSLLAFWAGPSEARVDELFRQSGLMRQKWERADYRTLTLAAALNRDEFWGGETSGRISPRQRSTRSTARRIWRGVAGG